MKNSQRTLIIARVAGNSYILRAILTGQGAQQVHRAVDGELRNATALWHRRLGHAGSEKLAQLSETVDGVPVLDTRTLGVSDI